MRRDTVIELAREAGYIGVQFTSITTLEKFAALVAAHERQAIGEDLMLEYQKLVLTGNPAKTEVEHCLNLIRLRAAK